MINSVKFTSPRLISVYGNSIIKYYNSCFFLGKQAELEQSEHTVLDRQKTFGSWTCFTLLNSNSPRYAIL